MIINIGSIIVLLLKEVFKNNNNNQWQKSKRIWRLSIKIIHIINILTYMVNDAIINYFCLDTD